MKFDRSGPDIGESYFSILDLNPNTTDVQNLKKCVQRYEILLNKQIWWPYLRFIIQCSAFASVRNKPTAHYPTIFLDSE